MTIAFENESAILDHYMETGETWLSVVAADGWPYIITSTEDGDVFVQGFPCEAEEGAAFRGGPIESGTEWLSQKGANWYPVSLVAPLPETTLSGEMTLT